MQSLINKFIGEKTVDFSSVIVTYQTDEGLWRGFVMPFDITYEAEDRDTVVQVLKDMHVSYVDGLRKYDNPEHLANVPLSHAEDSKKWQSISIELINKLRSNISKIETSSYYAEAQLPA